MTGSILDHSLESSPPPLSKTTVGVPCPLLCIHSAYPPTSTFRATQSATAPLHKNIVVDRTSVAMSRKDALRDKPIEEIIQTCTCVLPFCSIHPPPNRRLYKADRTYYSDYSECCAVLIPRDSRSRNFPVPSKFRNSKNSKTNVE